jgi:hypothetical protein
MLCLSVLAQNQWLLTVAYSQPSQARQKKSSWPSMKQQMIGGSKPHCHRAASTPSDNPAPVEAYNDTLEDSYQDPQNPFFNGTSSSQPYLERQDVVMDEAGSSGFNLKGTEPEPHSNTTDCNKYGLSMLQCSSHITELIDQVGHRQWGTDHVLHVIDDDDLEEEVEIEEEESISDEEDFQEADEEFVIPSAEPGQEGVSLWDLLDEGFLKEASEIGISILHLASIVN